MVNPAHNELDLWAVPRDGMSLEERIRWLGRTRSEFMARVRELEAVRDLHVPDYPPEER